MARAVRTGRGTPRDGSAARPLDSVVRVRRPLAVPPPPPPHLRRRRRAGARRAHAAQRRRAGQGPPRLPVRRLARDRQDVDGEDPRRLPELRARARPSSRAACCDSCVAIASATSLDVIEMDAASNNSVDDIRDLRERVAFAPVSGRPKVYILDEAHMLSSQAWNAFLKTLEEPPPNTIFVLATTEAQQGAADGRRPLPPLRLRAPDRRADRGGAAPRRRRRRSIEIARRRRSRCSPATRPGSFRDALGTLEQLVTYSGHDDRDRGRARGARRRRRRPALRRARRGRRRTTRARRCWPPRGSPTTGRDPAQFMRDLEAHARELLVVQTLGEVPAELRAHARARRAAGRAGRARRARRASCGCSTCSPTRWRRGKDGADARTQLELALVKAAAPRGRPVGAGAAGAHRARSRRAARPGPRRAARPRRPRRRSAPPRRRAPAPAPRRARAAAAEPAAPRAAAPTRPPATAARRRPPRRARASADGPPADVEVLARRCGPPSRRRPRRERDARRARPRRRAAGRAARRRARRRLPAEHGVPTAARPSADEHRASSSRRCAAVAGRAAARRATSCATLEAEERRGRGRRRRSRRSWSRAS